MAKNKGVTSPTDPSERSGSPMQGTTQQTTENAQNRMGNKKGNSAQNKAGSSPR